MPSQASDESPKSLHIASHPVLFGQSAANKASSRSLCLLTKSGVVVAMPWASRRLPPQLRLDRPVSPSGERRPGNRSRPYSKGTNRLTRIDRQDHSWAERSHRRSLCLMCFSTCGSAAPANVFARLLRQGRNCDPGLPAAAGFAHLRGKCLEPRNGGHCASPPTTATRDDRDAPVRCSASRYRSSGESAVNAVTECEKKEAAELV